MKKRSALLALCFWPVHAWSAVFRAGPSAPRPSLARPLPAPGAALTPILNQALLPAAPLTIHSLIGPATPELAAAPALFALTLGAQDSARWAELAPADARAHGAALFDLSAPRSPSGDGPGVPTGLSVAPAELPPYLSVADPSDRTWIARVVGEAQRSKTARRVLGAVARLAAERGRPFTVVVTASGLSGEYDYDSDVVGVNSAHKTDALASAVPTLIHELQHVLQRQRGLPSDAFELELEAYLVDFQVCEELGWTPQRGTFDQRAHDRFRESLDGFLKWLQKEYPDNIPLIGSSAKRYAARLTRSAGQHRRRLRMLEGLRAKAEAVSADMRATGQPASAVEAYEAGSLKPVEARLRRARVKLQWAARDLALLHHPETRGRYETYARRVLARARAMQRDWSGRP